MGFLERASWLLHGAWLERREPGGSTKQQSSSAGEKGARRSETVGVGREEPAQDILWRQSCLDLERDWPCVLGRGRGGRAAGKGSSRPLGGLREVVIFTKIRHRAACEKRVMFPRKTGK